MDGTINQSFKQKTTMKLAKPSTSKIEQRAEEAYEFMKGKGFVTKPQLADLFGWQYPKNDRQIRDVISVCAQKYPIISTSDSNKGFKVAGVGDMAGVEHSIAELLSRISELQKRIKPLMDLKQKPPINATYNLFGCT
jgi:hypothetical protein